MTRPEAVASQVGQVTDLPFLLPTFRSHAQFRPAIRPVITLEKNFMIPLSAPSVRFLVCLGAFTSGPAALTTSVTAANASAPVPQLMKAADRVPWTNVAELEAFAARGHLQACAQLGEQLLRGDGVSQNIPRALPLLEQAARGGIGSAIFRLGMVYDEGLGVTRDRLRALEYFRAAATAGEPEGFFNVGAAYAGAHGVKRDYTEGLAWIILAAKRGAGGHTEQTVRDRILKLRRPDWITAAEARAPVIERELAAKKASVLLPVAPSLAPAPAAKPTPAPTLTPTAPIAPAPAKIQPAAPALTLPFAPPPTFDLPPPPPPKSAPIKP